MARIRTVKPEFWTSEQVMECSPIARLLFVGMWNFCDDGGNHPASAKTLKAEVFPADDFSTDSIQLMVDELVVQGLLLPYEADGKRFLHVTGWHHQKIEKPNFKHPSPPDQQQTDNQSTDSNLPVANHSTTSRLPIDPVMEGSLREVNQTNPDGLVVASNADDQIAEQIADAKTSTVPNCPQQALLDLYAECLPELPQPRAWEGQAADALRTRWRWVLTATKRGSGERYATTAAEGVEWFRRFFGYVAGSDFLMGRKADWQADLRWLVKAANFDKVLSGSYENGRAAA